MKFLGVLIVAISCGVALATETGNAKKLNTMSMEDAMAKLAELKKRFSIDDIAMPVLKMDTAQDRKLALESFKKKFDSNVHTLPDFEDRKVKLESLKKKITDLRATQATGEKPNKSFFAEVRKTLEESLNVKMVDVKVEEEHVPKSRKADKDGKVMQKLIGSSAAVKPERRSAIMQTRVGKMVEKFAVENFAEEIARLQEEVVEVHGEIFDYTRLSRVNMVNLVFDVMSDMMHELGSTTETLWHLQQVVQDYIDAIAPSAEESADTSEGTSEFDCEDELEEAFATETREAELELQYCARYAYNQAYSVMRSTYYPRIDRTMMDLSALKYLILENMALSNVAVHQAPLIKLLDNQLENAEVFERESRETFLEWEQFLYADEMATVNRQFTACLTNVEEEYEYELKLLREIYNECNYTAAKDGKEVENAGGEVTNE